MAAAESIAAMIAERSKEGGSSCSVGTFHAIAALGVAGAIAIFTAHSLADLEKRIRRFEGSTKK